MDRLPPALPLDRGFEASRAGVGSGWPLFRRAGVNPRYTSVFEVETFDVRKRVHCDAERHRLMCIAPQKRPRKQDAIFGVEGRSDHAAEIELRDELLRFLRREDVGWYSTRVLDRDVALERGKKFFTLHQEQVTTLAKPNVDAHLGGETFADLDRLLHQAHGVFTRPLHADAAAVSPRSARAE